MGVSVWELLWTQAWSGSPVYLMAGFLQGLWLHRSGFDPGPAAAGALASTALAILLAVVLWGRVFAGLGAGVMAWDVLNIPAAVASILVYPATAPLIRHGFGK